MPKLEYILKRAHFVPDEIKLAVESERIIFDINISCFPGERQTGATFEQIKIGLSHLGVELPDERILEVLRKMEKVEIENSKIPLLSEIYGKWHSNCKYSS